MEGPVADLAQRVTALGAHKIYVGSCTGDGADSPVIGLGFTPMAVCVSGRYNDKHSHRAFTNSTAALPAHFVRTTEA